MENIKKEFYSGEEKDAPRKMGRRAFMKQALGGLGALVAAPYVKAMESVLLKERVENIFEEKSPEKIINRLNYINEKIGAYAANQLGCAWLDIYDLNNRPEAKRKLIGKLNRKPERKKGAGETVITDSLKKIGLEPEVVQEFLKTLPKSWRKEVALITYIDKPIEVVANEITGEKYELVAHHQSEGKEELSEVHFFPGAKKKKPEEPLSFLILKLYQFLIYEYAHANNWRNRVDLSLGQRINLFYEVIKRVESPDRFEYEMVEKIGRKDKKHELRNKAVEYWAAISMYSMMCIKPTKERPNTQPPETDMKLVFNYLKMTDSYFDILKMAKKRLKLLKRIQAEIEASSPKALSS